LFRTVTNVVIVKTDFVGMLIICLHTKFNDPTLSGPSSLSPYKFAQAPY